MTLAELQAHCAQFVASVEAADAAHDISHVRRVANNVAELTRKENADARVTLPAAWLHDCVAVAKNSPLRAQGSKLAAQAATEFLRAIGYPGELLDQVFHAIEAHSYSAAIPAHSLEARVVQDGDRLDSLGAIGIARCLLVGGRLNRPLCSVEDPFCEQREPDDARFTVDHFYAKLFKLPATMQTAAGRAEAERRAALMRDYLSQLRLELCATEPRWP
ncbi:MAG TPA: HD domain-containing protein [Xanthomonadales bacterium]|nr:HD domain-containing protein [Xanthomonadales bacterium]